jgi:GT2 family glycosyltransferase
MENDGLRSEKDHDLQVRLSIIILCWNDLRVIPECLRSIYATTRSDAFEVIVSDNGSTDGSIEFIRQNYPQARVIENGRNLRFAKANNVGIRASRGEYVLILNPDTIIHDGTLDRMMAFADRHAEAGAFGCRVLNSDGSYQESARPFASLRGELIAGLYLRAAGYLGSWFSSDTYAGWKGETERTVDWVTGCFIFARSEVLRRIGGFDEQFFYYYEDMDLCRRIWQAGSSIIYTPEVSITHLKGQSTNQRMPPITFALDSQVTRYLYFYKYYGERGARQARLISLLALCLRRAGYAVIQMIAPQESRKNRLEFLRSLVRWNYDVDPVRLVENGEEPRADNATVGRVLER